MAGSNSSSLLPRSSVSGIVTQLKLAWSRVVAAKIRNRSPMVEAFPDVSNTRIPMPRKEPGRDLGNREQLSVVNDERVLDEGATGLFARRREAELPRVADPHQQRPGDDP